MRNFLFFCCCLLACFCANAQFQIGVFGGLSNYQGDLVDKPYKSSRGAGGLTLGYQLTSRINLRAGFTLGKIAGADSLTKQEDLQLRHLDFQSGIAEFSLVGEFNTFDLDLKRWSPYVFAGLSVFHHNPYTFDASGNKVFLQPLTTEGQGLPEYDRKPYSLTQLALPFGGGIKFNVTDNFRLALEVGIRKTFTDYLDDVSGNYADASELFAARGQQSVDFAYRGDEVPVGDPSYPAKGMTRGSPKYKDYYYFSGLHLTFVLPEGGSRGDRAARKSGYGCPTVF